MEERRFDDLTRVLGKATSRRQVLKGLLGGLAAVVAGGAVGARRTAAAAGCSFKDCEAQARQERDLYEQTTCPAACSNPKLWLGCLACKFDAKQLYQKWVDECRRGDGCLTSLGELCCGSSCVDIGVDPSNCGDCGHVCKPGEDCVDGQCQCGEQGTICNGQCVDTQIDAKNCGGCGHVCPTCQTCVNGQCVDIDCGEGNVCCQDQCMSLCPGAIQPDPTTCQCPECDGKPDGTPCGSGGTCCNQRCVDTQSDDANCGACGHGCTGGEQCVEGICQCLPGATACNGQCVDLSTDSSNCGSCGHACDAGAVCCAGTCCASGDQCCSGVCKQNCGECVAPKLPCANGDCCDNTTDYACCDDGCCPQVTLGNGSHGAFCLAPGNETFMGAPAGNCCQPADLIKLSSVDPTTGQCDCSADVEFGVACAGNLPPGIGEQQYCSCGPWLG